MDFAQHLPGAAWLLDFARRLNRSRRLNCARRLPIAARGILCGRRRCAREKNDQSPHATHDAVSTNALNTKIAINRLTIVWLWSLPRAGRFKARLLFAHAADCAANYG